ncbi:hypothetical protein [Sphingomonas quercus]|uniref:Flagellar FliJ protein n=1 Tax=Sphingomonas quercus TaxID=2842451 RepID=A0ABS6BK26_9SPHN|nr:hypothetical protein [Sphingomonas quercus]MBU3078647.1 hypothetical protein [Sphingomonas quercus]
MKTPYDAAARVRQREIDDLRKLIDAERGRLAQIDKRLETIAAALVREARLAADDPALTAQAYMDLLRAERARLVAEKPVIEARLAQLRDQTAEAYGALRAIETAAADYRHEAERILANAEQTMLDDIAATSLFRRSA